MLFSELVTYTRARCGIQNNQTIDDATLMTFLNQSLGSLDLTLCTDYEDYNVTTYLCSLGNNQNSNLGNGPNNVITMPSDFFKLRAVDFGSPGAWITVFGFGLQQRNRFNNPYSNMFANYGNQVNRKVRVMGNQIIVEPLNLCSGQYQIWYTPKYTPITDPTQSLPQDMDTEGFIEYAVSSTGIKVYNLLLLPTQGFMDEMKYYEEKVRNGAKNRMALGPKCVQNVRNRGGWGGKGNGWGM